MSYVVISIFSYKYAVHFYLPQLRLVFLFLFLHFICEYHVAATMLPHS